MLFLLQNARTLVARQIVRPVLSTYQPCCLNSDERHHSHNQPYDKRPVCPDNEEKKEGIDHNDSLMLSLSSKMTFSIDTLAFLHQIPSIKWATIKEWRKNNRQQKQIHDQRFIVERLEILGSDLAAAHFIVHRSGAIKFKDQNEWIRKDKEDNYSLPSKFVANLYLEAIDASQTGLLYEGFQNLEHLYYLKSLNLSQCKNIDDWCLDRLHIFKETLEHLDISGCPAITERGLSCLYRLRNLKTLNVADLPNVSHIHLVCLLLEEALPHCQIVGVDYTGLEMLEENTAERQCREKT